MDFRFLRSLRFWSLVGIAIVGVLTSEGILPDFVAQAIITILAGYTVLRTVDRGTEFIGGARKDA